MGIIDDYYGGYENLAIFTDWETGEVDFESAYNFTNFGEGFRFPGVDSDGFEDSQEEAQFYAIASQMSSIMRGEGGPEGRAGRSSGTGRGAASRSAAGGRHGRGGGRGEAVPGWQQTGQYTASGQQLYAGACSSCGQQCTVPFRPVQGRAPPCCRSCHNSGGGAAGGSSGRQRSGAAAAGSGQAASTTNA